MQPRRFSPHELVNPLPRSNLQLRRQRDDSPKRKKNFFFHIFPSSSEIGLMKGALPRPEKIVEEVRETQILGERVAKDCNPPLRFHICRRRFSGDFK